jgi:hypothetical protein
MKKIKKKSQSQFSKMNLKKKIIKIKTFKKMMMIIIIFKILKKIKKNINLNKNNIILKRNFTATNMLDFLFINKKLKIKFRMKSLK